jgi:hypothetical protein
VELPTIDEIEAAPVPLSDWDFENSDTDIDFESEPPPGRRTFYIDTEVR